MGDIDAQSGEVVEMAGPDGPRADDIKMKAHVAIPRIPLCRGWQKGASGAGGIIIDDICVICIDSGMDWYIDRAIGVGGPRKGKPVMS